MTAFSIPFLLDADIIIVEIEEGVAIFQNQFHKYLKNRATFYLPMDIEISIEKYSNLNNYDMQFSKNQYLEGTTKGTKHLLKIINKYQKGVEQGYFISNN